MPSSPLIEETNIFSYSILSGGEDINAEYGVLGITITQEVNKIGQAKIVLRDGSTAEKKFEVIDKDKFKPGSEIEIKLGYQSKNDSIFKGVVVKQSIRVDEGSISKLEITCKDKADSLTRNRENATFTEIKDSDLIQQLIEGAGLTASVTATTIEHKEIVQSDSTSWDLLNIRAAINGMVVVTDVVDGKNKVTVDIPELSDAPELQIQFGYDMVEFDTEIDATNQYSGVECSAWDIATQAMITATAEEPTINEQGDETGEDLSEALSAGVKKLKTSGFMTEDELQTWADAELLRLRLSRFTGSVTFHGSAKAKANSTIKLLGLSDRFNGNAYISGVTHTVDSGRWQTVAQIGLPAESFAEVNAVSSPTASGLIPGINGLQTGIVKKVNEDPDNEFRVQVTMPILGEDSDPVWARLSTFYAGNGVGAYFMPEVNDEVILGFMNDDPRFPIILGSVFSSSIPAPETPDEENTIKTLMTQGKLQLKFDDENKELTVVTPGLNTIVLSDKAKGVTITDQNENTIQMDDKGVVIESKSALSIKAANAIKIEGDSIELSGSSKLDMASSGGPTTVKGTTVAIN